MRAYIANTDYDWYRHLLQVSRRPAGLDEANFWRPSGRRVVKPAYGSPFVFKLKKQHGHAIVGFGLWAAYARLSVEEAWQTFGEKNGAATREAVWKRVVQYVQGLPAFPYRPTHPIGCDLIAGPVFFPEELWIAGPADWKPNIVTGKGYEVATGEGRRIWHACLERAALLGPAVPLIGDPGQAEQPTLFTETNEPERFGAPQLVRPRLGQGTFRYAVQTAYGKCAVTREHSLPALDAAHIVPVAAGGPHEISNGLLLRADIHRLFDRGYVTVTPDYQFKVSPRLANEFDNGKVYYELEDRRLWLPKHSEHFPKREWLEQHEAEVFLKY
ncbi:MAG: HNH endonuclease [Bacteroidota bacterium]